MRQYKMKYIKEYRLFENNSDDILVELVDYLKNSKHLLTHILVNTTGSRTYDSIMVEEISFKYNDQDVFLRTSRKFDDPLSINYRITYDNKSFEYTSNDTLANELYKMTVRFSDRILRLSLLISSIITKSKRTSGHVPMEGVLEIRERLDEFDVIINNEIDLINLERLFNFYDVKFAESIKLQILAID